MLWQLTAVVRSESIAQLSGMKGSSGSHVNGAPFPTDMMGFDRSAGPETHTYSAIDIGILTDLGYTRNAVTNVPEPGILGLVLAGLFGGGCSYLGTHIIPITLKQFLTSFLASIFLLAGTDCMAAETKYREAGGLPPTYRLDEINIRLTRHA